MQLPIVIGLNAWKKSGKDELCALVMSKYGGVVRRGFADPLYEEVARVHNLTLVELKALKAVGDAVPHKALSLAQCSDMAYRDVVYQREFDAWLAASKYPPLPTGSTAVLVAAFKSRMRGVFEKVPRSFRSTLQPWGTEYRRNTCAEDYWVLKLTDFLAQAQSAGIWLVLVNDVRFDNEWDIIESGVAGRVIRIIRAKIDSEMHEAIAKGDTNATHNSELAVAARVTCFTITNEEGNPGGMLAQFEQFMRREYGANVFIGQAKPSFD